MPLATLVPVCPYGMSWNEFASHYCTSVHTIFLPSPPLIILVAYRMPHGIKFNMALSLPLSLARSISFPSLLHATAHNGIAGKWRCRAQEIKWAPWISFQFYFSGFSGFSDSVFQLSVSVPAFGPLDCRWSGTYWRWHMHVYVSVCVCVYTGGSGTRPPTRTPSAVSGVSLHWNVCIWDAFWQFLISAAFFFAPSPPSFIITLRETKSWP